MNQWTNEAPQISTELIDFPKNISEVREKITEWKNAQLIIKEMAWFCKSFSKCFINSNWWVKLQLFEAAV